jgi:hypothetical protein
MADTAYIITRAFQDGKQLTPAQKGSSLFAEEPVVLGKVLRRGSRPMRISAADFKANEVKLLALEKAGSILIKRPATEPVVPPEQLDEAQKKALVAQHQMDHQTEKEAVSNAGDAVPPQQEEAETQASVAATPPVDSAPPAEVAAPTAVIILPAEVAPVAPKPVSLPPSDKKKGKGSR